MAVQASAKWKGATISEGSLKQEDLLSAFADTIDTIYDENQTSPDDDLQGLLDLASALDTDDEDEAEAVHHTLICLEQVLDDLAPEGCVFGAHEGDAALFGFWLVSNAG